MPIDRTVTLRNAEKLVRQGRLEQAIGEYLRLVDDQPRDWNTANMLGDLYVRAARTDKAIEQYVRIADALDQEGFLPRAAALYKKILKLAPTHEHALVRSAEIAGAQGLLADARNYLAAVAEQRRGRGDERGMADIALRLATLDPTDLAARAAARAHQASGESDVAVRELTAVAAELRTQEETEALDVLAEASRLDLSPESLAESPPASELRLSMGDESARGGSEPSRTGDETPLADVEIDLSGALEAAARPVTVSAATRHSARNARLQDGNSAAAEMAFARGLALEQAGQLDESIAPLEAAACSPHLRFQAASRLGRVHRSLGRPLEAIEWFERAAEAPPPLPQEGHTLLYELADTLESVGEHARALAVYLELKADAGDYRDVAARVDRLVNIEARGQP